MPRFGPPEILPLMQTQAPHKLKPDVLMVSGNVSTPTASRQVHIVELKCCQDTSPQHDVKLLERAEVPWYFSRGHEFEWSSSAAKTQDHKRHYSGP